MILASGIDPGTITLIVAVVSCLLSVISMTRSGGSTHEKEGERWGAFSTEIKVEMKYIRGDLEEIKAAVNKTEENSDNALKELKKSFKDNVSYLHERIDQHLRDEHNQTIPKRKP